jgi:hypothetical protein
VIRRRVAWILILIVDVGCLAWGAMAAFALDQLIGPGGKPILPAGYEGFTGLSWQTLVTTSPRTAAYITLVFRMYGVYNLVFGILTCIIAVTAFRRGERWAWWALLVSNTIALVGAMSYDKIVKAIGPFELTEYLGLALVFLALALTARAPKAAIVARAPRAAIG